MIATIDDIKNLTMDELNELERNIDQIKNITAPVYREYFEKPVTMLKSFIETRKFCETVDPTDFDGVFEELSNTGITEIDSKGSIETEVLPVIISAATIIMTKLRPYIDYVIPAIIYDDKLRVYVGQEEGVIPDGHYFNVLRINKYLDAIIWKCSITGLMDIDFDEAQELNKADGLTLTKLMDMYNITRHAWYVLKNSPQYKYKEWDEDK